ncbi:MAG TPA: hypothetical protein VFV09_06925 [Actinomycetota bacterium]|jgi:hypothetical protein|nr:hypothetical protein [Actinomycetota bacterium]
MGRRLGALVSLLALLLMLAPPAGAAVPFKDAAFSGYATGTYLHVDALTIGTTPTVKADVGFAGASVNSKGLSAPVVDELGRTVSPTVAGKNSYGAGFGLDANLLGGSLLAGQQAAAAAPPSTELVIQRAVDLSNALPGVLAVGALEGRAQARYDANTCILGADMSYGQGDAADLQLLGGPLSSLTDALLGTDPGDQDPGAVRSSTRTRLVPQTNEAGAVIGDKVALMTEVKQTLAPIVLFQGIPGAEITIELLGEWTMRVVATGIQGQAYVQYMPGTAGNTPVLSITQSLPVVGPVVDSVLLTLNQLLGVDDIVTGLLGGEGGLLGLGLVDLELNPDPTIVESADGTSAKASVDVVKLALLPTAEGVLGGLTNSLIPGLELADVRVGHMEAAATVPAGGIQCPDINVAKAANPDPVNAGSDFVYTIDINNPYDCTLTDVKVVDTIEVSNPKIKYTIKGQEPAASSVSGDSKVLTWNDVGPIDPKGSKQLKITVNVDKDSPAGNFIDTAAVTANCGLDTAQGGAKINLALAGGVKVLVPKVQPQVAAPLPRTGGNNVLFVSSAVGLGLISILSAAGYRRLRRSDGTS